MIAVIIFLTIMWKLHLRRTFTKVGFGLRHLGFRGDRPTEGIFQILKDSKPIHQIQVRDWRYLGYNSIDELYCVLGVSPFGSVDYIGAAFRPPHTITARVVGRIPHPDREYDGYFSIMLERHLDQVVNFTCPIYRGYQSLELPVIGALRLCLYPSLVRVFDSQEELKRFNGSRSSPGQANTLGLSRGLFNFWEYLGRPVNHICSEVYACGQISSFDMKRNSITGRPYYITSIDIGSGVLDVVSKRIAFFTLPEEGNYIAVIGQLTGYLEKWKTLSPV